MCFLWCFSFSILLGSETITVTVTGSGPTIEKARKSAIQKAVRKALGEVVDAETIAENGELIKDEVLTYSDGFISKTLDISGPEKDADLPLFTLTIQAEVIRSKVVKRLKEVNIKVVEIDGNSLFAQALGKMEKAQGGQQLLAKVLNEDLDPAKLIKCDLIHRDTSGKLVRGSYGPDAVKILGNDEIELTTLWEVSVDLDAYFKQALPRLSQVINQVSKRKIFSNFKRTVTRNHYNNTKDKMYYSHPNMVPIFAGRNKKGSSYLRFDDPWIDFGYKQKLNLNYEPKDSPWRITSSKEEFYVAIELRSNPDRTESDFEIHVFDVDTFLPVFSNSISRILPTMRCTAKNKNEEIIFEREIIEPKYLLGNNKDKAVTRHWNMKHGSKLMHSVNDPLSSKSVGICKVEDGVTFTISPELVCSGRSFSSTPPDRTWSTSEFYLSNSLVMEVKEKITMEQAKKITSLTMQPISRNAN